MSSYSQFSLLKQRRFLPFFLVQALGAFNDNVYRQAIIGLLGFMAVSADEKALYAQLAPAIFILPYFLFSSIAGQFAERTEEVLEGQGDMPRFLERLDDIGDQDSRPRVG